MACLSVSKTYTTVQDMLGHTVMKFDFITEDGTRCGERSKYVSNTPTTPIKKTQFSYFDATPYGGIKSLIDKLSVGDASVANVLTSNKWLIGYYDIFYCPKQTIKMLPVMDTNGVFTSWNGIIDNQK